MICRVVIFIFSMVFSVCGAFSLPEYLRVPSKRIVTNIIKCNFTIAFNICDSLIELYPNDPMPHLLKLTSMGMRDVDCEQTFDSAGFIATFQRTSSLINDYKKNNGVSSYILSLDGFSKAMHAAFFLRKKAYFDVLHNGLDAIKLLSEAKELDPTNTDVDFFLGLYDYGKAELKKKLWWVIFWYPGSKADGIRQLTECSKSGFLTSTAAKLSLSDIYLEEKKPEISASIVSKLEGEYKDSRFVLWAKAKYLESKKQYDSTALVYERLSEFYALIPEGKHNFLFTRNRMAHMLKLSGKKEDAAEICRALLNDKQVNKYRDIKNDTRKLLENIDEGNS